METLEQTRQKLVTDEIALIERTIQRLKMKQANLMKTKKETETPETHLEFDFTNED